MSTLLRGRKIWLLLLLITFVSVSIGVGKKTKTKKGKDIPAGRAVLWRDPADIHRRNLLLGPGGEAMKPDLRQVTLIEKEKGGGYSTKYRVRDAAGNEWVAKVGKEAQSETAASRLMWGVGYYTDTNYLVPEVTVNGIKKPLRNVRFSARPKGVKRVDGFEWKDNPFVGSREFQGLKVMMALMNNWDIKDSNNKILVVPDKHGQNELQYEVHDLGGSFGKVSHVPRFLQFKPDRNNPKAYASTHLVDKVKDGRVSLHYSPKQKGMFKDISVEDARWVAGLVSRLSDRQIEDAFRSANYTPEQVRVMRSAVRRRVAELNGVANSQLASRPRRVNEQRRY
jgi:hypothetical protein